MADPTDGEIPDSVAKAFLAASGLGDQIAAMTPVWEAAVKGSDSYPWGRLPRVGLSELSRASDRMVKDLVVQTDRLLPKIALPDFLTQPMAEFSRIKALDEFADYYAALAASLQRSVTQLVPSIPKIVDTEWFERSFPWFTPDFLRRLLELGRPANWTDDLDLEKAQALAVAGWPIVWVPRSSIVAELITAPDDAARKELIVERRDEILTDCEEALGRVDAEELKSLRDLVSEAISAARQNLTGPAQAAATNAIDTIVGKHLGLTSSAAQKLTVADVGAVPIRRLVLTLIGAAIAKTFKKFYVDKGDPEPDTYNRHASVHSVSDKQYTRGHALLSLMMAVSALCQVDHDMLASTDR